MQHAQYMLLPLPVMAPTSLPCSMPSTCSCYCLSWRQNFTSLHSEVGQCNTVLLVSLAHPAGITTKCVSGTLQLVRFILLNLSGCKLPTPTRLDASSPALARRLQDYFITWCCQVCMPQCPQTSVQIFAVLFADTPTQLARCLRASALLSPSTPEWL